MSIASTSFKIKGTPYTGTARFSLGWADAWANLNLTSEPSADLVKAFTESLPPLAAGWVWDVPYTSRPHNPHGWGVEMPLGLSVRAKKVS